MSDLTRVLWKQRLRLHQQNSPTPLTKLNSSLESDTTVLEWCISNVVGRYDARGNVYPRKEREENKIDGAIALIMTIGRATVAESTAKDWSSFTSNMVIRT